MTPVPLLVFLWGIAIVRGLLPHRILFLSLPKTPAWFGAGRVLGVAAVISSGLWLILDWTLPAVMHSKQSAISLADRIGWASLAVAAIAAVWEVFPRQPTSPRGKIR